VLSLEASETAVQTVGAGILVARLSPHVRHYAPAARKENGTRDRHSGVVLNMKMARSGWRVMLTCVRFYSSSGLEMETISSLWCPSFHAALRKTGRGCKAGSTSGCQHPGVPADFSGSFCRNY